jgi:glycerate kinase
VVATDVSNPLLGQDGAAAVFGPQKGARPAEVELLDAGLDHLSGLLGAGPTGRGAGVDSPGAGAAGGLG